MRTRIAQRSALAVAIAGTLLLSACGSSSSSDGNKDGSADSPIAVVASTNVWGNVAEQVGGDAVKVTSIISSPDQDPHSFEGNTGTVLAVSKAKVVIENGGGYDDFVDTMLKAHNSGAAVLNAVDISGKTAPAGGDLNEHVWYDVPSVGRVADRIATELGKIDPAKASTFTDNATAFKAKLDKLTTEEAEIKGQHAGDAIAITEPVPIYLTEAAGLVNKTPVAFSKAIEEGEDISAAVLKETLDLYTNNEVKVLLYNEQTSGPITDKVKAVAKAANIGIVPVTETLPSGLTYVSWMQKNLDNLKTALAQG
jgi:zinc/manganese transport system substrate-binding protein